MHPLQTTMHLSVTGAVAEGAEVVACSCLDLLKTDSGTPSKPLQSASVISRCLASFITRVYPVYCFTMTANLAGA